MEQTLIRDCPECGAHTLVRFEWAHTTLPEGYWYWRCALEGGCWAGPFVMEANVKPLTLDEMRNNLYAILVGDSLYRSKLANFETAVRKDERDKIYDELHVDVWLEGYYAGQESRDVVD